ncbi:hypothetical protein AHAS_Ahas17G0179200 [Arachis hypogaea]
MEVNGCRWLVSMVVRSDVEEVVHWHMMELAGNYKGVYHIYHLGWSLSMVSWKVLLPKGLIRSLWFLPFLIVLTLMHIPVITSIPFNNIGTKLKARGVRTHSS